MKITVFWDVTLCKLVNSAGDLKQLVASSFSIATLVGFPWRWR